MNISRRYPNLLFWKFWFVEFITMKIDRSGSDAPRFRTNQLRSLRAACGIWQDRDDLPNFQALRREWDRA